MEGRERTVLARMSFIIKNARYLYTVDSTDQVLENATLVVRKGVIESINPTTLPSDVSDTYDGTDRLLMPGLINSHSHLAMALLRGWAESVSLDGFLKRVWAAEAAIMDKETCALGTELGAAEAIQGGTTTVLDMYFHPEYTHPAAIKVGLRHVTGPFFFDFLLLRRLMKFEINVDNLDFRLQLFNFSYVVTSSSSVIKICRNSAIRLADDS